LGTYVFLFLVILAVTRPMAAHHGSRISYDMTKMVTVKGVVKDFHFANPHVYITFDVKDNKGEVTEWGVETDPPLMMINRYGWSRRYLKAGDEVTVTVWPSRYGTPRGFLAKLVTADGRLTDHSQQLPPDQPEGR
jgi:Family of unknown function (DUF6152)